MVNALLREGSIIRLDTDREGGPFFAPDGYVEPADRLGNSDLVLGGDYVSFRRAGAPQFSVCVDRYHPKRMPETRWPAGRRRSSK